MRSIFYTIPFFALPLTAAAEPPRVVADIAPVHALVSMVMEGVGEPTLLIPTSASPHGHSLRPSEADALQNANLVFWIGEALTPWMESSIDTLAKDAKTIELLSAYGLTLLEFREEAIFENHDHEHEHEGAHHEDEHHHEGVDPHAWLAPENAIIWLDLIAEELAEVDPENAPQYRQNATSGISIITLASTQIMKDLSDVQDTPFIVFHDAYHYFEASFGVEALASVSVSDATAPGPKRVQELRNLVEEADIKCIFTEPQFDPRMAQTVIEGSDAQIGTLDPLGSGIDLGSSFYPELLNAMAQSMRDCLSASES